jgi:hypothetical protein
MCAQAQIGALQSQLAKQATCAFPAVKPVVAIKRSWKQWLIEQLTPPTHPWEAALYRIIYAGGVRAVRATPAALYVSGKAAVHSVRAAAHGVKVSYHGAEAMWRMGFYVVSPIYGTASIFMDKVDGVCLYLRSLEDGLRLRLRAGVSAVSRLFVTVISKSAQAVWSGAVHGKCALWRVGSRVVPPVHRTVCDLVRKIDDACAFLRSLEDALRQRLRAGVSAVSVALSRVVSRCTHAVWSFACSSVSRMCVMFLKLFVRVSMALGHWVRQLVHMPTWK